MPSIRACRALALFSLLSLAPAGRGDSPEEKEYGSTKEVERRLAAWKPTKASRVPGAGLRAPKTDVAGRWGIHRGQDSSTLTVRRKGPETYSVVLWFHCCVTGWRLERTGRYVGGVLSLDKPVEAHGMTYQKLHAVRIGGRECLL